MELQRTVLAVQGEVPASDIARLPALWRAAGTIGHASPSTTATHYLHFIDLILAALRIAGFDAVSQDMRAAYAEISGADYRQKKKRADLAVGDASEQISLMLDLGEMPLWDGAVCDAELREIPDSVRVTKALPPNELAGLLQHLSGKERLVAIQRFAGMNDKSFETLKEHLLQLQALTEFPVCRPLRTIRMAVYRNPITWDNLDISQKRRPGAEGIGLLNASAIPRSEGDCQDVARLRKILQQNDALVLEHFRAALSCSAWSAAGRQLSLSAALR